MKKNHKHYGQVQLGMAPLNVRKAEFLMYASFEKSFKMINILFDTQFVINILGNLKKIYFNILLPKICLRNDSAKENHDNNKNGA